MLLNTITKTIPTKNPVRQSGAQERKTIMPEDNKVLVPEIIYDTGEDEAKHVVPDVISYTCSESAEQIVKTFFDVAEERLGDTIKKISTLIPAEKRAGTQVEVEGPSLQISVTDSGESTTITATPHKIRFNAP